MKRVESLTLVALLALAGCVSATQTQTVEVRITPDGYQVGSVKSALATAVVDEVVRINPQRVLSVMCRNTPSSKISQFPAELTARNKAMIQGTYTSKGCSGQLRSA